MLRNFAARHVFVVPSHQVRSNFEAFFRKPLFFQKDIGGISISLVYFPRYLVGSGIPAAVKPD